MTRSALYLGWVRHRRERPVRRAFTYAAAQVRIDLDELEELERRLPIFGHRRWAPIMLRSRDHFDLDDRPLRVKLEAWLRAQGRVPPAGRVEVLTGLHVLGTSFDPVSWWLCHDAGGRVALVVAEVHNTFGERHAYLLEPDPDGRRLRAGADKRFHVSPYIDVDRVRYRFALRVPDERSLAHVEVLDAEGVLLDATQVGRRRELTTRTLLAAALSGRLWPVRTLALIHAQALRLWRAGLRPRSTPAPPAGAWRSRRSRRRHPERRDPTARRRPTGREGPPRDVDGAASPRQQETTWGEQ